MTGDLGREDKEGNFTFFGREDDVINSAGYRIGPSEVCENRIFMSFFLQHHACVCASTVANLFRTG